MCVPSDPGVTTRPYGARSPGDRRERATRSCTRRVPNGPPLGQRSRCVRRNVNVSHGHVTRGKHKGDSAETCPLYGAVQPATATLPAGLSPTCYSPALGKRGPLVRKRALRSRAALGGAALGGGVALAALVPSVAFAQDADPVVVLGQQINLLWIIIGAALVIFMQAGFADSSGSSSSDSRSPSAATPTAPPPTTGRSACSNRSADRWSAAATGRSCSRAAGRCPATASPPP
jgi:hypothetical protein